MALASHEAPGHGTGVRANTGHFDYIGPFHKLDIYMGNIHGGSATFTDLTVNGPFTVNIGPAVFNTTVTGINGGPHTDEFVTRNYVDTLIGSGAAWLDSVLTFADVSVYGPAPANTRIIQTVTVGPFIKDWIYRWDVPTLTWVVVPEDPPIPGNAVFVIDPLFAGNWWWNGSALQWVRFVMDHTWLTSIGINTHAQIDTHINNTLASMAHVDTTIETLGFGVNTFATFTWAPAANTVWQAHVWAEAGLTGSTADTFTQEKMFLVKNTAGVITVTELKAYTYADGAFNIVGPDVYLAPAGANVALRAWSIAAAKWRVRVSTVGIAV